jgi:hypothetical protein
LVVAGRSSTVTADVAFLKNALHLTVRPRLLLSMGVGVAVLRNMFERQIYRIKEQS